MNDLNGQFIRFISRHHQGLHAYILSLHPNHADADDILQETAAGLWRRFEEFDPGRGEFFPWACRFAYYEVLRFRKTQSRSKLVFSDELLHSLGESDAFTQEAFNRRRVLLRKCLSRLSESEQELLHGRYDSHTTLTELSARWQLPVKRLYKRLEKIRLILFQCVDRQLNQEGIYR